jgi:hypothetical protein
MPLLVSLLLLVSPELLLVSLLLLLLCEVLGPLGVLLLSPLCWAAGGAESAGPLLLVRSDVPCLSLSVLLGSDLLLVVPLDRLLSGTAASETAGPVQVGETGSVQPARMLLHLVGCLTH